MSPHTRLVAAACLHFSAFFMSACGGEEAGQQRDAHCDIPIVVPPCPTPAPPPANVAQAPQPSDGQEALKTTVREYIRKLMDEPRKVAASEGHAEETRGGPGNFSKLSEDQIQEFVAAIIAGSQRFLPASLTPEQKAALVAAEISAESAFQPGTAGLNPNPSFGNSCGPLQLTTSIWLPLFKQYAKLDGLTHYDGSAWRVEDTTVEMVEQHIFENILASLWAITEQGRRGAPEWLGQPNDGPAAKTMWTGQFCWVAGAPAVIANSDPSNQRDHYRAMMAADLGLLGFPEGLLDTPF